MSLDNIQLPVFVIHDLFKDCLVDLNTKQIVEDSPGMPSFSFLGNNRKQVTVVVNDSGALYLADTSLNFLLGILAACQLTMEDIALVNRAQNPAMDHAAISERTAPQKMILFGTSPADLKLPLEFPHYQVQPYSNQVYLAAPALEVLMADRAEKTRLWNCLKQLFSLG